MGRCARYEGLEVYLLRRDGGAGMDNVVVLCHRCHDMNGNEPIYVPERQPLRDEVVWKALELAGYRCQCTSDRGCH